MVFDGDLVLVVDEPTMLNGVHKDIPYVIDVDDKITVLSEEDTPENLLKLVLRNFNSLIGEASNAATTFHSIEAKTPEQAQKYLDYIDTLSVVTGKSIDMVKTGILFPIPRHIAKYAKPLPYFMKYRSPYYKNLKKWRNNNSNMNMMCRSIERWEKVLKYNKVPNDSEDFRLQSFVGRAKKFDYTIMIDDNLAYTVEEYGQIENIYLDFCSNIAELSKEQYRLRNYNKYKSWIEDTFPTMTKEDAHWYTVDWQFYYNSYRLACKKVVKDPKVLTNIVVDLCYRKYKSKSRNFLWIVASEGLMENLDGVASLPTYLPIQDDTSGDIAILGKKYRLEKINDQ